MRRTLLTTSLITAAGLALTGVSTCGPQGPAARDFAAGSLVIPMDGCYQKRVDSNPMSGGQTTACNATGDDGIFRAYGLVYFLLKHNIPVYWAIDNTKPAFTAPDLPVSAPASGAVAQKMSWSDGSFADLVGVTGGVTGVITGGIKYIGGPFVIDAADAPAALTLFQAPGDFAQFKSVGNIEVHKVMSPFHAAQVRPLSGPPPKIAILNIAGPKTSADVMIKYAKAAGFDWTCSGACTQPDGSDCDCAGGISTKDPNCTKAKIATNYSITVNNGPGKVYDILCDKDFLPDYTTNPPDFSKSTLLAKDGTASYRYKLLWAPHWETPRATCPAGTVNPGGVVCGTVPDAAAATGTVPRNLADWLTCIRTFVAAGNNLFAECHAIVALEGGFGLMDTGGPIKEFGLPVTRFQTTAGMNRGTSTTITAGNVVESVPAEPYMQIADFTFSGVSGNVTSFFPDPAGNATFGAGASDYGSITRYIAQSSGTPKLDVMTGIKYGGESGTGGSVVYMGGHDYSSQTAGTRIVLNTLFNLGFGCSDPGTTCTTGLLGACAQGVMKCAGGGGLQCSGPQPGAVDCTTPGADANCNGIADANEQACQPVSCTEGAKQECYDGPASTDPGPLPATKGICTHGLRICTGGLWGPCQGQVLPRPEVCNGIDDSCTGAIDQGSLCGGGYSCQAGICLPDVCNLEAARCPAGFDCTAQKCVGQSCAGNGGLACGGGQVCQAGQCKNPCDGIACGLGSSCSGGLCVAGGCALDPAKCSQSQLCVAGSCVTDPCAGSSCPTGTFCRIGPVVNGAYVADCVRSCSYVGCATGQSCGSDGFCQSDCSAPCATGQVCQNGTCADDPCAKVLCGSNQECRAGTCVDSPCGIMHQCSVGSCVEGQCVNGGIKTSQETAITPAPKSGGCGTGGGADLATLALGTATLLLRRRRLAPVVLRAAPVALATLLALGFGCAKGTSPIACTGGDTACGGECAALETSTLHCGACGHGCAADFQCTAGSCVFPTGNPHLVSVEPATIGLGASPALKFTFEGLAAQPTALTVRLTGAVTAQELPLTVDGSGTATLPAQAITLDGETTTVPIEARLLNMPARLVSNPLTIKVVDALVARTVSPALARQDQPGPATLTLQGLGFVSGATVSFGPAAGGATQSLPIDPASASAVELTVTPPAAGTLAVGRYSLVVTNPGGVSSTPLPFTVSEGAPVVASVAGTKGTCVLSGTNSFGRVTGSYLYPSSVAHVTGNSIVNSPLDTSCASGTDPATGQCQGGQLNVFIPLQGGVPEGSYDVTVVNPGPTPLVSGKTTITVAASCP